MSSSPSRLPRSTALFLALGLAAGCASASGGANGTDAARADGGPTCQGDCWLRVDNRLRRDGEVSTERLPALPDLGIVRANATELFHLEGFTGEHVEIWVHDAETGDLIGLDCIRQFRQVGGRKQGRMVLGEGGPAGTSGC